MGVAEGKEGSLQRGIIRPWPLMGLQEILSCSPLLGLPQTFPHTQGLHPLLLLFPLLSSFWPCSSHLSPSPQKTYPCLSLQYSEGSPFPDWSVCVCVCVCVQFSNLGRCFSPLLLSDPHSHPCLLQSLRRGLSSLRRLGPLFSPSTLEVLIPPSSQAEKALRPLIQGSWGRSPWTFCFMNL